MNQRLSFAQKSLLIVIGIGVGLMFITGVDRFLGWTLNRGYFKAMAPNVTHIFDTSEFSIRATTSVQGLRNPIVTMPKPKGIYRILALGDSYTYGWGVEENDAWPRVLESLLRKKGLSVEVINAGVPGAGPTEERHICRAYADQFDIDAIILGVYTDDLPQAGLVDERLSFLTQTVRDLWPILTRINQPIISRIGREDAQKANEIHVQELWKAQAASMIITHPALLRQLDLSVREQFIAGRLNPGLIGRAITDPDFFNFLVDDDRRSFALAAFSKDLERFHDRCTKNLPAIVLFLPGPSLVSEQNTSAKEGMGFHINDRLPRFDLDSFLSPIVEKESYRYHSVLSLFRQDGCRDCHYQYDGHLTKEGHRRVAEFIANRLAIPFR